LLANPGNPELPVLHQTLEKMKPELPLRILYVSYPLLTVSESSAGGAEQMLWVLEREMSSRGMETMVAASAGSQVTGELLVTGQPCSRPDDFERRNPEHQDRIIECVQQCSRNGRRFDVIHDESGSFWTRAHEIDVPVLATLHLPRHFYAGDSFENIPENVVFNCVSDSQAKAFHEVPQMIGVTPNGIALDRFHLSHHVDREAPRSGMLWLGRVCEEKAPHLALDIAQKNGMGVSLAGQIYPFTYHQHYFEREILARLRNMPHARWIDSPSFIDKLRLLRTAQALLITSQVDETSSLVAMEAAACGTPVIAFNRGALAEVVEHGKTGYVVRDIAEAVDAIKKIDTISPDVCMTHARQNFSSSRMAERYSKVYQALVCSRTPTSHL
jgi:glycosyltransferase involved in cell wall biosynthesis